MPTSQQIDELFDDLGSTFSNTTQDIDKAKKSTDRVLKGVEDLRSIFEEQVHIMMLDHEPPL